MTFRKVCPNRRAAKRAALALRCHMFRAHAICVGLVNTVALEVDLNTDTVAFSNAAYMAGFERVITGEEV